MSCRLMVSCGARRNPRVVPLVVNAATEAIAINKAMRVGRRFFGAKFIGAATGRSLRLNCQRAAA